MPTKKMIRSRLNKSSSSIIGAEIMHIQQAEKVASVDDLLTEILFRLPTRSLLRFKTISKHWYHLIANHNFKLKHLSNSYPVCPLGLFVPLEPKRAVKSKHIVCDFVPFDIEVPVKPPFRVLRFDRDVKKIKIEDSSNGLLLCESKSKSIVQNWYMIPSYKYYVYNPSINQFIKLPKPKYYDKSKHLGMTIAYDPSKSPHYKIIFVSCRVTDYNRIGTMIYMIEIYSSETKTCKPVYPFELDGGFDIYFGGGVYWNNAVHWHHDSGVILYFKLDEEVIDHIDCPSRFYRVSHDYGCIYESRGHLLVVEIPHPPNNVRFKIHELKKDYSGWIMKYHVDLEQVCRSFPEIVSINCVDEIHYELLSLVLGEKDEDSFLVLEIRRKAIRFNIVSMTCHKLLDFTGYPRSIRSIRFDEEYVYKPNVFQFAASLCSV